MISNRDLLATYRAKISIRATIKRVKSIIEGSIHNELNNRSVIEMQLQKFKDLVIEAKRLDEKADAIKIVLKMQDPDYDLTINDQNQIIISKK